MRLNWQNLNESGRDLLRGRAWLRLGRERRACPSQKYIGVEWRVGRWCDLRLMFTRAAEDMDYGIAIGLGFAALHINLSGFRAYNAVKRCTYGFDYGMYLYGDHLVLQWGRDDYAWEPTGWYWSCFLKDVLLGVAKYSSTPIGPRVLGLIQMPEGSYGCSVQLSVDEWRRPRWFTQRQHGAQVDIPNGIPVPGKGENSWDCGEYAIYGMTLSVRTADEAIAAVVASAIRTREKYGGRNWRPAAKEQA